MSKGRYHSKKNNTKLIWLIVILTAIVVVLLALAWSLGQNQPEHPEQTIQTEPGTEATLDFSDFGELDMGPESGQSGENWNGENSTDPAVETTAPNDAEIVTQPPVEIIQQAEADYERWLAAAMLISISMEYPDFEITGIYLASETTLEGKMDSKGCYIIFNSFGETMAVHGVPLSGERSTAGTKDISSQTIGFATFDAVDPAAVDTASMIQIDMEELGELISQSMLVSIYSH